jgi:hypothetical protein
MRILEARAGCQSQPLTGRQRGGRTLESHELVMSSLSVLIVGATHRGAGYELAVIAGSEIGGRVIGVEVWIVGFHMSVDLLSAKKGY